MRRSLLLLAVLPAAGGCELREITLATPDDVIIAEVVLRAGEERQTAYLHRTSSGHGDARVYGAHITITEGESGASFDMEVDSDSVCLDPPPESGSASVGTCYSAAASPSPVRAGHSYTLRIELPGGLVLTGATTVPAAFTLLAPATDWCMLPADTTLELVWSRSAGTAVYIVEAEMQNLRGALRQRGQDVPGSGPVELVGLSVTAEDTTLTFPSELGLFERFDEDVHPILVAIRAGLPPGVTTEGSVAAADRNYVNWVRGGNFNPSGQIRISSLRGDGVGVFGSLVTRPFTIVTPAEPPPPEIPSCN